MEDTISVLYMRAPRSAIRFPLEAAVAFWWKDEMGTVQHSRGRSRDISEHGVFVLAEHCPLTGDRVELKIVIDEVSRTGETFQVDVKGHVLRVDELGPGSERCGFAVLSDLAVLH